MSKSLKQLGFRVYAVCFFSLVDECDYVDKLIVVDSPCFDPGELADAALDYVDEVDYVLCCSDVDAGRFPRSKVIGNVDTGRVNNKYKLYKRLAKDFLLPETYLLDSVEEASEIVLNNRDKRFLVKPVESSGGAGIRWFDKSLELDDVFLLQEYVSGDSVSSSFLSYPDHSISMVTSSDQIIGSRQVGGGNFLYCGNITPYVNHTGKLENISSKISRMCKLVGSNGVDFVIHDNKAYVIEVNPRIQGTFECVENSFGINMAEAHINASRGIKVDIPAVREFCVKLISYSPVVSRYDLRGMRYVHDISDPGYLFKKNDPVATIVVSDRILENAMSRAQHVQKQLYKSRI